MAPLAAESRHAAVGAGGDRTMRTIGDARAGGKRRLPLARRAITAMILAAVSTSPEGRRLLDPETGPGRGLPQATRSPFFAVTISAGWQPEPRVLSGSLVAAGTIARPGRRKRSSAILHRLRAIETPDPPALQMGQHDGSAAGADEARSPEPSVSSDQRSCGNCYLGAEASPPDTTGATSAQHHDHARSFTP